MKFWEALKALDEGKKVRNPKWDSNRYIEFNPLKGCILDPAGNVFSPSQPNISRDDWELYEEPKKTKVVYQWRYKDRSDDMWYVYGRLMTDLAAMDYFKSFADYEIHAGPFTVEE